MNVHSLERFDAELDAYAAASRPPLSSVLVSRCGNIVSEHYWGGQAVTSYRPIFSVTKSVVSALIGLALADGKLTLTDTLAQWFTEMDFAPGSHAASVTIQHLLTMTSGFEKLPGRVASEDRLAVLLRRRSDALAGETFHYLNEDIDLLIAILERATGESAIDYAYRRLFTPLGLWSDVPKSSRKRLWKVDKQGHARGGHGLHLTTRELARFGQFYLQGGRWQGEQLLPEAYVTASTTAQVSGGYPELVKYGYLWWVSKDSAGRSAFFASGAGGQYIYVLPELNLITVITGTSTLADGRSNRVMVLKLVTKFLLSDA